MFIVNGVSGALLHCINFRVATDKDNPFCKEANWKNLKVEDALEKLAGVDVRLELKKQKEDKKNETDRKK